MRYQRKQIQILGILLASILIVNCKPENSYVPGEPIEHQVQLDADAKIISISAGKSHSIALTDKGEVYIWGYDVGNSSGMIERLLYPTKVSLDNIVSISAGGDSSLALLDDGTVWFWGDEYYCDEYNISDFDKEHPAQIAELTDIMMISAEDNYRLVVNESGQVFAWGTNTTGELGNGQYCDEDAYIPELGIGCGLVECAPILSLIDHVEALDGNQTYAMAIKDDGSVWAWGAGTLGDGKTERTGTPVRVELPGQAVSVTAGGGFSLVLLADGTVWGWGGNSYGTLGTDKRPKHVRELPVQLEIADVTAISADSHVLALKSDGTVWAWGRNIRGQVGDGTTEDRYEPVQVKGLTDIVAIDTGGLHSLALQADGTVWAWGLNEYGQLGNGTTQNSMVPIQVEWPEP